MMKTKLKNWPLSVAMVFVLMVLVLSPVSIVWAGQGKARVFSPHAYPFGMSYGEWSAEWWKWQLSLPYTDHPVFSLDGADCATGQVGKVWFLTGAFSTEVPQNELNTVVRESCSVPTGKAILFPIINVICSNIEIPPFQLIEEGPNSNVETCASSFVEGPNAVAGDLFVEIDGRSIENIEIYQFQSPVFDFEFSDPSDNILGVDCSVADCDNARSVSDGFWVMLPPLSRGDHTIRFTGSFREPQTEDLIFGLDVTYLLTVGHGN